MKTFQIERDFMFEGLRCVVIMGNLGHRCGYVGIPKEHPLYGIKYTEKTRVLNGSTPECDFDVHGGITYSGGGNYPVESNLWWFGFDCGHWGDGKDLDLAFSYGLMNHETYKHLKAWDEPTDIVRSEEYVGNECEKLAKQLNEIE